MPTTAPKTLFDLLYAATGDIALVDAPSDPHWVGLLVAAAVRGPRQPLARRLQSVTTAAGLTGVDPDLVGRFLALPGTTEAQVCGVLYRTDWEPAALARVVQTLLAHCPVAALPALTAALDPQVRRGVFDRLRAVARDQLKQYLGDLRDPEPWLADAGIDIVPVEALRYFVRAATDADAVARRLLSLGDLTAPQVRAAAARHTFSVNHTRRLATRVRQLPAGADRDEALALLAPRESDARTCAEAGFAAGTPGAGMRAVDYRALVAEIGAGRPLSDSARTQALLHTAAEFVPDADIDQARRAWLRTLPHDELVDQLGQYALPGRSGRTGRPTGRLGTRPCPGALEEMVRRTQHGDEEALDCLLERDSQVLVEDDELRYRVRHTVPVARLAQAPRVCGALVTEALAELYAQAGLDGAEVLWDQFATHRGSLEQLTAACAAALAAAPVAAG